MFQLRMRPLGAIATAAALTCAMAAPASAQNIEKLKQMKVATTDLNIPMVPQTGKNIVFHLMQWYVNENLLFYT